MRSEQVRYAALTGVRVVGLFRLLDEHLQLRQSLLPPALQSLLSSPLPPYASRPSLMKLRQSLFVVCHSRCVVSAAAALVSATAPLSLHFHLGLLLREPEISLRLGCCCHLSRGLRFGHRSQTSLLR